MIDTAETAVGSVKANSVPKNLVIKLCEILGDVDRVPKRGRNEFHKYDYVMEPDLVEAVRQKLAERHVFLLSSVEELRREDTLTEAKVKFTFLDGDTGESLSFYYVGQGDDKGDKGAYKAYTGALKYAIMKNFLVPTGDDPEADTETDRRANERYQASRDARAQAERPARTTRGRLAEPRRPEPEPEPKEPVISQADIADAARRKWYAVTAGKGLTSESAKELLRLTWWKKTGEDVESTSQIRSDFIEAAANKLQATKPVTVRKILDDLRQEYRQWREMTGPDDVPDQNSYSGTDENRA